MAKRATETALPDNPTFEQAARAAIAEHSHAEQAGGDDEGDEDTQGDEGDEGDESDDDDAEEADGEDADGDEAEGDEDAAEGEEDEEPGRRTAPRDEPAKPGELISDKEFQALSEKHADDPKALRKALDKVFTQKMQALSKERRTQERVEKYGELIEAYEQDPGRVIRALAEEHDLLAELKPGDKAPGAAEVKQSAEEITAALLEEFRTELGSDYDYLADPIGKATLKLVTSVVKDLVAEQTKTLRDGLTQTAIERGKEKTEAVMSEFAELHPDWTEHEDAMFQLSQRLAPQKGMTEIEYLENLYTLVTAPKSKDDRDAEVARGVKRAVEKMRRKATTSHRDEEPTPERHVRSGPPAGRNPTFEESYQAAKRGERWD